MLASADEKHFKNCSVEFHLVFPFILWGRAPISKKERVESHN